METRLGDHIDSARKECLELQGQVDRANGRSGLSGPIEINQEVDVAIRGRGPPSQRSEDPDLTCPVPPSNSLDARTEGAQNLLDP